jgi:hypothetical protein
MILIKMFMINKNNSIINAKFEVIIYLFIFKFLNDNKNRM